MERRFYQLSRTALPEGVARLADTVTKRGMSVGIVAGDQVHECDEALWEIAEFLPHAVGDYDGISPVHIVENGEAKGEVLFLINNAQGEGKAKLICHLFHASDIETVKKRREDWKRWRDEAVHLTYWAENAHGGWEKKAEENGT